jgi:ribosomal protein S18 acetylase RimI-like enzyme
MDIKKYRRAGNDIASGLKALIRECSGVDGYCADVDLDASMNAQKDMNCIFTCEEYGKLTALLSVFAPGREDIEVNALVHPAYRRRGIFKALLREAIAECSRFGYEKGLFVINEASVPGRAVAAHWGCGTDHAELQMERDLDASESPRREDIEIITARESDLDELADIGAAAFSMEREFERELLASTIASDNRTEYAVRAGGRLTALAAAYEAEGKMLIFGLGVHPGERRKGYAKALICHIAEVAFRRGIRKLCLDVDEDNEGAIALYESLGFKRTSSTEYRTFYFDSFT